MKRRQFITLTGLTAVGAAAFPSPSLPATDGSHWQPDGAGLLARIGVLTPNIDPVPESEMWAMAPPGVSIHGSPVVWNDGPRAFAEPPYVDDATERLVRLAPRAILYAFTSSSYVLGAGADNSLRERLEKRSGGIPVILTCVAATEALRLLGAHRVALIHPRWFPEQANAEAVDYFRAQGFEVPVCARMTPVGPFTEVPPAELYQWVTTNVPRQADAVFIGGNGLRAIGAIQALEESLGKPVLTANQVLLWKALRLVGTTYMPTQYGRVFTQIKEPRS